MWQLSRGVFAVFHRLNSSMPTFHWVQWKTGVIHRSDNCIIQSSRFLLQFHTFSYGLYQTVSFDYQARRQAKCIAAECGAKENWNFFWVSKQKFWSSESELEWFWSSVGSMASSASGLWVRLLHRHCEFCGFQVGCWLDKWSDQNRFKPKHVHSTCILVDILLI